MKISDVQRTFPRRFRGYDPVAVRAHLEQVAEALAQAEREASRLRAENEGLKADLGNRFRSEHTVAEALLQAQELAAKVRAEAEAEARAVVEAARAEAERVLSVARAEADARRAKAEEAAAAAERRLEALRAALAEAVSRGRAALSAGLEAVGVADAWLGGDVAGVAEAGGVGVLSVRWRSEKRRGFTLTEVLVVVVVLGILAGITVGVMPAAARRAKRSALVSTLAVLQEKVHQFYAESNRYPCAVQPTEEAAQQLDPNAVDARGATFLEGYVRFAPDARARELGLDPAGGETVYYGIAYCGRVFATQVAPQSGWTDGNTLVWVQDDPWRPHRLADVCGAAAGPLTPGGAASITLWASQEEAQPGESITVNGRVVDSSGNGVPNARVRVDITGSVTGTRSQEVVTAQDGTFSVDVTTDTPEYVVVSATVIG